ncbi:hypothetical protein BXY41_11676 [Lacrimispora xylanisolvens]|uniref:Uncharacterized protein n=1 Tax=Lacrimispora xylanisolvens TaxID=384636 RepID=A0A2S6HJA1_9FIRM|nr:hypothetical protein [Hungatella xylanolytica]PPK77537.1 hypothetical protein BXY41_11676 [Hungatella xylanolytica]
MKNKTMDQLKNLVAFNAAISDADEDIQIIQKEMASYGYDDKYVDALNDLKQKVICYRYQKVKICLELYDKIENMEDEQEKRLMKYRYIRGYTWDVIADKMGYSVRQIFNIHNKSLSSVNHFKI